MKVSEIKNKERVIDELMLFIRKVINEPEICDIAKQIARKHINEKDVDQLIADELSNTTNVKIAIEKSDADLLFLELLKDLVRDEKALY
ncbi:hypothetical protein ADIMK_2921 [Marinobacterium lacunae]|uniref:Uncharacterized protein n=1 Tax=Marinobacterium lacunae TaxID=1232683 RepID=A0A081FWP6_9GAMM|nr:hypothetical protein [Marinobacterium lacunae]KEA62951.1 hypothetical protein ADIMK_2921 [Marinobacterium lacunae]MBR9883739.1 hypothetical protein [Oceanospirillales bacterium]